MLTKKQLIIFWHFAENIFREYTYKELRRKSKEKSNNALQTAIKRFKEEKLIKERKIGTSRLYSLNVDNDTVYHYFSIMMSGRISDSVRRTANMIEAEIEKHTSFYSIVIFGSYATGEDTLRSDLDVAVFIDNENKKKLVEAALNSASDKSPLNIDGHVITDKEYLEMLLADYENVGKQIARKHVAISNPHIFYSLLIRGVKNGFRI